MKIVRIIGGLGNQMFQYALAISLQTHHHDETVKIDLHGLNGYHLHNGFELGSIFNVIPNVASLQEIMRLAYPYPDFQSWRIGKRVLPKRRAMCVEAKNMQFDPTVLNQPGGRYFDGYWQNEAYFVAVRPALLEAYAFPPLDSKNSDLAIHLAKTLSVAIHVRRGDYITDPLFKGTCTESYYARAIDFIARNAKPELYCIFSDDIPWCKQRIEPYLNGKPAVYVDWNLGRQSYRDMQLMSLCKHNIIANSSFSWWGAWLNQNPDKLVVGPGKWANIDDFNSPLCPTWMQV